MTAWWRVADSSRAAAPIVHQGRPVAGEVSDRSARVGSTRLATSSSSFSLIEASAQRPENRWRRCGGCGPGFRAPWRGRFGSTDRGDFTARWRVGSLNGW